MVFLNEEERVKALSNEKRLLSDTELAKLTTSLAKLFTRSMRVVTKYDLYARLDLVSRSIRQWAQKHPFLQAKVAEIDGRMYFTRPLVAAAAESVSVGNPSHSDDSETEHQQQQEELSNVEYLFMKSNSEERERVDGLFTDVSMLLAQREIANELDPFNELLWRLKFFTIVSDNHKNEENDTTTPKHEYEIILLLHHSVSEGTNIHMILMHLIELLELNFEFKDADEHVQTEMNNLLEKYDQFLPCKEDLYLNNFTGNAIAPKPRPLLAVPSFVDKEDAARNSFRPFEFINSGEGLLIYNASETRNGDDELTCSRAIKLSELINESRAYCMRNKRIKLSKETSAALLLKCKENGGKLTGALNMLFGFALNRLFAKHGFKAHLDSTDPNMCDILISTQSTFRKFKLTGGGLSVDKLDLNQMGYLVHMFKTVTSFPSFDELVSESCGGNKQAFIDIFWSKAREDTRQLHERIDQNLEMFVPPTTSPFYPLQTERHDSLLVNINISNVGVLPHKTKLEQIVVEHAFNDTHVANAPCQYSLFYIFVSTLNGHICLTINNNSHFFKTSYVDEIVEFFHELVQVVIAN